MPSNARCCTGAGRPAATTWRCSRCGSVRESGLEFIDSTGLRIVIAADARARKEGRRLVVVAGPPSVHRVFRIALLDRRLEFVEDAESIPWTDDDND